MELYIKYKRYEMKKGYILYVGVSEDRIEVGQRKGGRRYDISG